MNESFFLSIALTGFVVAFAHSALPTHWLPFVLAGRAQNWSKPKTLWVTAFASLGHVLFTTILGILVLFFGIKVEGWLGGVFPLIVGDVLIAFGVFYLVRQWRSSGGHHHWQLPFMKRHDHDHNDHDHSHPHGHDHRHDHSHDDGHSHSAACSETTFVPRRSDRTVIIGLLALLTFSPCEGFLPVYLSGIQYGWSGFALLSVILAGATMAGMVFFTFLTLVGLERLKLEALEKYEAAILGTMLCLLGILVIIFEHAG